MSWHRGVFALQRKQSGVAYYQARFLRRTVHHQPSNERLKLTWFPLLNLIGFHHMRVVLPRTRESILGSACVILNLCMQLFLLGAGVKNILFYPKLSILLQSPWRTINKRSGTTEFQPNFIIFLK
jgi:hypothetical protein